MASILPRNAQRGRDVAKQLKFQLNWKVTLKKKEPDLNLWPCTLWIGLFLGLTLNY